MTLSCQGMTKDLMRNPENGWVDEWDSSSYHNAKIEVKVLLDSGAIGLFINHVLVQDNSIATCKLNHPILVFNIAGSITEEVTLICHIKSIKKERVFEVCNLGKANIIIGYTWLCKHNQDINWETGEVQMTQCPK
jgi:Retroviral aspartyl protease